MAIYRHLRLKYLFNSNTWMLLFLCIICGHSIYFYYYNKFKIINAAPTENLIKETKTYFRTFTAEQTKVNIYLNYKYILLWTPVDEPPFDYFMWGHDGGDKKDCEFMNCYFTHDRLSKDITEFDAIAFNGPYMRLMEKTNLPQQRSPHQKYIFFNMAFTDYHPICQSYFDNFYNWTATYKLNSDIVHPYFTIKDMNDVHIGPRINMKWIPHMKEIDEKLKKKLSNKTSVAAWIAPDCISRSKREKYISTLKKEMAVYNMTIDIYGNCGTMFCPNVLQEYCMTKQYYFYLSFEQAFAEDFVTVALLTALKMYAVPIVYGGSNYSRFLPPGSYIDARKFNPMQLAALMARIIATPEKYYDFFRWRRHYQYSESEPFEDLCNICKALNNKELMKRHSAYKNFRSWWDSDFKERCETNTTED